MSPDSSPGLPDTKILKDLERAILKNVGGLEALQEEFPKMIRKALDEVIDTPRTGRLTIDQIEKTEKTYILAGDQPQSLMLADLLRPFPDAWQEQRRHLGF